MGEGRASGALAVPRKGNWEAGDQETVSNKCRIPASLPTSQKRTQTQGVWLSGRVLVQHGQGLGSFLAQTTGPAQEKPSKFALSLVIDLWPSFPGLLDKEVLLSSRAAEASRHRD